MKEKDIRYLETSLIAIFQEDEINLASIRRNESIKQLNSKYKLKYLNQPELMPYVVPSLVLAEGEFIYNDQTCLVNEIRIESRRIIIKTNGTSEAADFFFEEIRKELVKLDVRQTKPEINPLIKTYETRCVCKLDIGLEKLIGTQKIDEFITGISKYIPSFDSSPSIIPFTLRFRIDYFNIPEKLKKNKITLMEKYITIEYREKTDPGDHIFFTSSPTKTEDHIKLLQHFEKTFS